MPIVLDDTSIDVPSDNFELFCVKQFDDEANHDDESTPTLAPQDSSHSNAEVFNDWCDTVKSNLDRFIAIHNELEDVKKDVKEALSFAQELTVPYNYEYARIMYIDGFNHLLEECLILENSVDKIPNDIEYQCMTAFEIGSHERKKQCINYLDDMMLFYDTCVSAMRDILNSKKKHGTEMYENSKLIARPCGY